MKFEKLKIPSKINQMSTHVECGAEVSCHAAVAAAAVAVSEGHTPASSFMIGTREASHTPAEVVRDIVFTCMMDRVVHQEVLSAVNNHTKT